MVAPASVQFPPLRPETPFYVIGDIHGRMDLLERLLDRLDPTHPLVFVGDYVDRGENSAEVLVYLSELSAEDGRSVCCLKGNHEEMLLEFIEEPEKRGGVWLRNGGLQTLSSFGVAVLAQSTTGQGLTEIARDLRTAMGNGLVDWLQARPVYWRSGNVAVVHAGADPNKPIEDQPHRNLIWGHPEFHNTARRDEVWVVHGHRIVDDATYKNGIISIDTGAYATGRLTAVHISADKCSFIST